MKVGIKAIGRMKVGPEQELLDRYLERAKNMGQNYGFTRFEVSENSESTKNTAPLRKQAEAEILLNNIKPHHQLWVLDERGKDFSTSQIHQEMDGLIANKCEQIWFVIGGPDGLDYKLRERADKIWSLSSATWPHQLVRVLVAEQLFRIITIFANHPYHREG